MTPSINRLAQALGYVKLAKQSLEPTAEFYEAYALEKLNEVESALITGITDIAKGGYAPRQLTRDDIIEMAKRDVAELAKNGFAYNKYGDKRVVKFIVNKKKRTVVALLRGYLTGIIYERGIAKCHPDDCFNAAIGRAIALRRALGLEVPAEYLNTPQPTEVRVGDIVESRLLKEPERYAVVRTDKEVDEKSNRCHIESLIVKNFPVKTKVIDDSRE
jgi:hypothetical protein